MACAHNRPTDVIFMQKTFFEIMKQQQGEYMGSLHQRHARVDGRRQQHDGDDERTDEAIDKGLSKAVKDFDSRFPPEWRLSKNRAAHE